MKEFTPFPKIPRLSRRTIITEKIDGTNASVFIAYANDPDAQFEKPVAAIGDFVIMAGSRTRWITPESDNYGFAAWVRDNSTDLVNLGVGHHFGEWFGRGINRNYGLQDRRFMLFNTDRWCLHCHEPKDIPTNNPTVKKSQCRAPKCCDVATVLYDGDFMTDAAESCLDYMEHNGSLQVPGFNKPEGIVIYHTAGNYLFKKTIEKDDQPKGK